MNDISVYLGRQNGEEGLQTKEHILSNAFFALNQEGKVYGVIVYCKQGGFVIPTSRGCSCFYGNRWGTASVEDRNDVLVSMVTGGEQLVWR